MQTYEIKEIESTTRQIVNEYLPALELTEDQVIVSDITYNFLEGKTCIDLVLFRDKCDNRHYTVLANDILNEDMIAVLFAEQIISDIDFMIAYNTDILDDDEPTYDDYIDGEADDYFEDLDDEEAGHDDETF